MERKQGWIGVDFDGTLAKYDGWKGCDHSGEPIKPVVNLIQKLLNRGFEVRIFTARVGPVYPDQVEANSRTIEAFCVKHFGKSLRITHEKDQNMLLLIDDRAHNPNCGICQMSLWPFLEA